MHGIRGVRPGDLDDLYEICLRTGAAGRDATDLMASATLLGDLFVAPYAVLEPEHAFVVHDADDRAVGYAVGAADTRAFEARCDDEWFPAARARHADDEPRSGFEALVLGLLEAPPVADPSVVAAHPSHLHIDLLPPVQSGGWGRRLLDALFGSLRAAGSGGVHLGVADANRRAVGFYRHLGFEELHADGVTRTFGLRL